MRRSRKIKESSRIADLVFHPPVIVESPPISRLASSIEANGEGMTPSVVRRMSMTDSTYTFANSEPGNSYSSDNSSYHRSYSFRASSWEVYGDFHGWLPLATVTFPLSTATQRTVAVSTTAATEHITKSVIAMLIAPVVLFGRSGKRCVTRIVPAVNVVARARPSAAGSPRRTSHGHC